MNSMSRVFVHIYRVFLRAFPRAFREECAAEMVETVISRQAEVQTRVGRLRMLRFWSKELAALLRTGVRLRFSHRDPLPFSRTHIASHGWYDLRFALRSLRRSPVFTTTATLTIALGIGATTVIFSFVNGILLAPLPYQDPAELVRISRINGEGAYLSEPEFMAFRTEARSLAAIAAVLDESRTLQLDEPRRIATVETTHELFPMLGVPPLIGRTFTNDDDLPGAARVAVLSHGLWQEMYGADPEVLGGSIKLDGESYEVVGVMPAGFYFPSPEVVLWSPYQIDTADLDAWNNHYLRGYARLKAGVDLATARSEMRSMGQQFVAEHPEFLEKLGFTSDLVPLFENMVGDTRTPLLVLLGAVGFLLLIGCTNVANLLLARGEGRKQEIAVRAALGASRGRVAMQLLMESLLLSLIGGLVGLLLAPWAVRALRSAAIDTIPRVQEIGIDTRVMLFTAGITVLTGVIFGLLPAITASRSDMQTHLKEGGRTLSGSRRGNAARRVLVASEVALSVVLVIGAGVMLRSLSNLQNIDTGFRTEDVLTLRVSLPESGHDEDENTVLFYADLLQQIEALPGVTSAGAVGRLPLFQGIGLWSMQIEGHEVSTIGEAPIAELQQVTPGYFETMDVSLLEGRFLDRADDAGSRLVGVVNVAFAHQHWPGGSAIGRRFKLYASRLPWVEIVGVVNNERHSGLVAAVRPKMYVPHAKAGECCYGPDGTMNLVVFGEGVENLARPIRNLVKNIDSAAPVYNVLTMEDVKAASLVDRSYPTLLLTVFGVLALFLASIGIYGLVAFQVNQGKHNIGIHVALGATAASVRRMVVGGGLIPVLVGIAVGLAGAFGLARLLSSLLYEVSPVDAPVYLGVSVILLLVAATASLVPAVRATRIDPVEVLRTE